MAYDKVVDSSVLDAGLKAIADAIREKGGTSADLAFPTAMAEAIAAIEAGGGGAKIVSGSFTTSSTVYNNTIQHDLGEIPNFAICFADATSESASTHLVGGWIDSFGFCAGSTSTTNATYRKDSKDITASSGYGANNATVSSIRFESAAWFVSGNTYRWYVGVI